MTTAPGTTVQLVEAGVTRLGSWVVARPSTIVFLSLVLASPSLWNGLNLDDLFHRQALLQGSPPWLPLSPTRLFTFSDGDPGHLQSQMDVGFFPWWTAEGFKVSFLRPLAGLTHRVDYALWPKSPALMHAHSLAWLALLVGAAVALYRRVLGDVWVAGLAGLTFGIDHSHAVPVGWLASRHALVASAIGFLALVAHDRWRRDGWQLGAWVAPVVLALALLASEMALAAAFYLVAYEILFARSPWPSRLASISRYCAVLVAWRVVYRALGYGVHGSGMYIDPGREAWRFVRALVERAPLAIMGQWGLPPAESWLAFLGSPGWAAVLRLVAWAWVVAVAAFVGPVLVTSRSARFWAAGMLLSLVPVCASFPDNRNLLFVGLGGMALLAESVAFAFGPVAPRRTKAFAGVLLGVHLVLAPLAFPFVVRLPWLFDATVARMSGTWPAHPGVEHQQLVIAGQEFHALVMFGLVQRLDADLPRPAGVRALSSSLGSVSWTRVDERSVRLEASGGALVNEFDTLFRGPGTQMRAGQRVRLPGMDVEVTAVAADGLPTQALFTFSVPLEDPSLCWLRSQSGVYVPFAPPEIGKTVVVGPG